MKKYILFLMFVALSGVLSVSAQDEVDNAELTSDGEYSVTTNWSDLKRGWMVIRIEVKTPKGDLVEKADLELEYDMLMMPMKPPAATFDEVEKGVYEAKIFLGMKGKWKFVLTVDDGEVEDDLEHIESVEKK